jgi:hypothetical protein
VNPTLLGAILVVALILIVAGAWWLTRDGGRQTLPPGRHQRGRDRAPQEPIAGDDRPMPDQSGHELPDEDEDPPGTTWKDWK